MFLWVSHYDVLMGFDPSEAIEVRVNRVVQQYLNHWGEDKFHPAFPRAWTHQMLFQSLNPLCHDLIPKQMQQRAPQAFLPQFNATNQTSHGSSKGKNNNSKKRF